MRNFCARHAAGAVQIGSAPMNGHDQQDTTWSQDHFGRLRLIKPPIKEQTTWNRPINFDSSQPGDNGGQRLSFDAYELHTNE